MKAMLVWVLGLQLFVGASISQAADWPQWMGPERDNVWREEGIVEKFPTGGPKIVWRAPVAGGYAGPAVADGKVYVADYDDGGADKPSNVFQRSEIAGSERVVCFDADTGKEVWHHSYPVTYQISYPAGPRCTPTVDGGKVYTLGAEGHLFCFDAESGDVLWSKDFSKDYGAKTALWGYAGHPLVDGDKLICVVGGEGSLVVAFDKNTGEELWKNLTSPEQGYAPPAIVELAGQRQLALLRPDAFTALDPETGSELWSVPFESDNGLVVMTPIVWKEYLFLGGYSDKSLGLKLAPDGKSAEIIWRGDMQHGVSPVNVQPIAEDGTVYGFNHTDGRLYAVDIATGNRLWDTLAPVGDGERPRRSATAFIVRQADRYWLFTENGDLILANLTPEGYEELGRAHILEPTGDAFGRPVVWCSPAFANKRMYVRNDKECVAVDLAEE